MKKLLNIILFLFLMLPVLQGDILKFEDSYFKFDVPDGWVKQVQLKNGFGHFFKWQDPSEKFFYQIHRDRKWAQWHMVGLGNKQSIFVKQWQKDSALFATGQPVSIDYNPESFVLTIVWLRETHFTISKMKLTSFGCLAFHQSVDEESEVLQAGTLLEGIIDSLEIPENLQFYPEDLASELINNMGGAVGFIVVSILYLMFSLFQRSQIRHRRLEALYSSRMTCSR